MAFDQAVMQKFMADHQSQYVGKYRYHSGYRTEEIRLKFIIICWIKFFAKLIFLWKFIV